MGIKDISEQRFGKLIAVRPTEERRDRSVVWECRCDCGNAHKVSIKYLRNGASTSCGCNKTGPREDLSGQRFGRLTVVKPTETRIESQVAWECLCECGTKHLARSSALKSGGTQSCGCLQKERQREAVALPEGESEFNRVIRTYKYGAKKRKIEFSLSKKEMRILTKDNCFYCGAAPFSISSNENSNGDYIYNGIDRVDASLGYRLDNVVTSCKHCNVAKRDMSQGSFAEFVCMAHEYQSGSKLTWGYWVDHTAIDMYGPGWKEDSGIRYKTYKHMAKKKGRALELNKEYFFFLTQGNCFYCGRKPYSIATEKRLISQGYKEDRAITYIYNGVDRINTSGDYTPDNTVPCCKECNMAKSDRPVEEFVSWIDLVYNHWAKDFFEVT